MIVLIFNSILLGIGLAMDAFSVSLAQGLADTKMKGSKVMLIAGTFAVFQTLMPLIGWLCVHTIAEQFEAFYKAVPYVALALLGFLGVKMILEGAGPQKDEEDKPFSIGNLLVMGVATSIDALSVGFTIADYSIVEAFTAAVIIGIVTFVISYAGVIIGKKFGTKLSGKASILGGVVLVLIGIEIFVKGLIG